MSLKLLIYEIILWIKPHFNNLNDKLDEKKSTIDETDQSCDHLHCIVCVICSIYFILSKTNQN